MTQQKSLSDNRPSPSFPAWPLGLIILTAIGARAWLQFGTPLAPGMNGAYYFVQARAVLEHGLAGVPDLPLTFWLHASLAWVIEHVTSLSRDASIVLAVKSADSILPPLAALPIAWLGWSWQRSQAQPSRVAALVPAALVCLALPALSMVGDFQKNSLALVLLSTLTLVAHRYLARPNWRSALGSLGLLGLIALTHIGTLGVALVFTALLVLWAATVVTPKVRRQIAILALAGAATVGIAGLIVYRNYDSGRIVRLAKAFIEPSSFLENESQPGQAGQRPGLNQGPVGPRPDFEQPRRFAPRDDHRNLPGLGAPGQIRQFAQAPGFLFLAIGLTGLAVAWYRRKSAPQFDTTVVVAAALTAAALGGPFYETDKAQRLMLIAIIPGAITLSYLLAAITLPILRRSLGGLAFAAVLASAALYFPRAGQPTITEATYAELQSLSRIAPASDRTLVVARHGLEWWTAWVLHTHIAQPKAVVAADWTKYDHIFYLTEKQSRQFPGSRRTGPNQSSGDGPMRRFNPDRPRSPNPNNREGPPFDRPRNFAGGARPGGGAGIRNAQVPLDASTVFDGTELHFAHAPTAPETDEATTFDGPPL